MPACGVSPAVATIQPPIRRHTSHSAAAAVLLPTTYARYPRWTTNGANHTQWWLQLNGEAAADASTTMATANTAWPRRYAIAAIATATAATTIETVVAAMDEPCRRSSRPLTLVLASGSCEMRLTSPNRD